jgi:signal transduction histidine kinase
MKFIHKIQAWIGARLWRRLMVSYLVIVLGGYLLLQLAVVLLIVQNKNSNQYPESMDAGIVAYAYAHTTNLLIEDDQLSALPVVMDLSLNGNIGFNYPRFEDSPIHLQRNPNVLPENWMETIACIHITDKNNQILAETGTCHFQNSNTAMQIQGLLQNGETNPMELNAVYEVGEQKSYIGIANIYGSDAQENGRVYVEMLASEQRNTTERLMDNILTFSFLLLLSSFVLGIPAMIIAVGLSTFSGWLTSRKLVKRLKQLEKSAQKLANGELSHRITDTLPDEIGQVGQAFNEMSTQLSNTLAALTEEKSRVENLLKAKKELTATISHDLRTPLATISLYLETLEEKPQRLSEYLPILRFETEQLSRRIDDLFELSRLDAQELSLQPVDMDINSLLCKILESYKELAWNQYHIDLQYIPQHNLPDVFADIQRVEQIISNLLMNAFRYTPPGGFVCMEVEKISKLFLEIRVIDSGEGIAEEDLPNIFERFFHRDSQNKLTGKHPQGSGLGLTIAKALVNTMGGEISASSVPGEGTCIQFTLPTSVDPTIME